MNVITFTAVISNGWFWVCLFAAAFIAWLITYLVRGPLPMWGRTPGWTTEKPGGVVIERSAHGDWRKIMPPATYAAVKKAEADADARKGGSFAKVVTARSREAAAERDIREENETKRLGMTLRSVYNQPLGTPAAAPAAPAAVAAAPPAFTLDQLERVARVLRSPAGGRQRGDGGNQQNPDNN